VANDRAAVRPEICVYNLIAAVPGANSA
jgi:hypothetical protein